MAGTDEAKRTTTSEHEAVAGRLRGRNRLALLVVVGSFLTLFLLIATLSGSNVSTTAQNVFNSILPVLAGWVGTVLAFYFSAASQESTSASLNQAIAKAGLGTESGTLVSEKMIPFPSIFKLRNLKDTGPDKILILELRKDFEATLPNGAALSRLLFVEGSVFKYVLHVGTLNAFIVKTQLPLAVATPLSGATSAAAASPSLDQLTFADLLEDQNIHNQISKLVVFVSTNTTMGDAKAALDKVNGAQDIIVTASGNATEPMLGWLSNVDLTKALTVS
jgi:hypothetical protein